LGSIHLRPFSRGAIPRTCGEFSQCQSIRRFDPLGVVVCLLYTHVRRRRVGFGRYSLLLYVSPELQKVAVDTALASRGSLWFFVYDARYSNAAS
jgi:chromosome condensin MukBEF complex kleisin-like MukF subunit